MLLRPIGDEVIGTGSHRSGWPWVMSCLQPLFDRRAGVLFDDFADKTFLGGRPNHGPLIYREPWIGAFHHPPDVPEWYLTEHLSDLTESRFWRESLAELKLVVTLGENLSEWFRSRVDVPCVTLKHPAPVPEEGWSPERFAANARKRLVQIGWYARNTFAIFQVRAPDFLEKGWLQQEHPQIAANHQLVKTRWGPGRGRTRDPGAVERIPRLADAEYDALLTENVVFVEFITAVATNTVIECIAYDTPIVLNRHPGPEFYLGPDYPLFYESLREVPDLVTVDRILEAHRYLTEMDKRWIDGDFFRESLCRACLEAAGSRRDGP